MPETLWRPAQEHAIGPLCTLLSHPLTRTAAAGAEDMAGQCHARPGQSRTVLYLGGEGHKGDDQLAGRRAGRVVGPDSGLVARQELPEEVAAGGHMRYIRGGWGGAGRRQGGHTRCMRRQAWVL